MNVIKLLDISYKEDIISNLIVGLINESKIFVKRFLENIVNIKSLELYEVKAFTRIATSEGIPDIVIKIYNEHESILVIIENKLKAEEGYNQTLRYSSEKCIKDLCENSKINLDYKQINKKFIYLTLIPEQRLTGGEFINITYRDILQKVNVDIEDMFLNKLYKDFLAVLNDFYSNIDINEDDKILELLCDGVEDEKIYMRFRNITKLFKFDNGLEVRSVGKTGGKGRISFIAKISQDNWIGKSKAKFTDKGNSIDANSYDIHLEFSFDILNKKIKLPLHYETKPYMSRKKLIKNFKEEDINKYINKRNEFKENLHSKIHNLNNPNIKTYNGTNQLASVDINIDNTVTVKKFLNIIEDNCNLFNQLVEESLK